MQLERWRGHLRACDFLDINLQHYAALTEEVVRSPR
jgi:hypothetical protein